MFITPDISILACCLTAICYWLKDRFANLWLLSLIGLGQEKQAEVLEKLSSPEDFAQ